MYSLSGIISHFKMEILYSKKDLLSRFKLEYLTLKWKITSHRLPFRDLRHLCIVQAGFPVDTGIGKISVHAVDLGQVAAAALRAHIHLQLFMTAVITVGKA